jgi:replication factor A1
MQSQTHDLGPHIEALKRALAPKMASIDEADLRDELQKYLDYGVPADQAVRTILRHHGAAPPVRAAPASPPAERTTLASLPADSAAVNIKARILYLAPKTVTVRGEPKEIVSGILGDETGSAPFTSWRALEGLAKGDVIEAKNAYTKSYNGQPQVNLGDRTVLAKLEPDALPKAPASFRDTPLAELKEGQRGLRLTGRVLSIGTRQVTVQGTPKTVWTGTLADTTGKVEFTAWADPKLEQGQAVTIEGGYIRAYRGVPQLSFDADARVTPATVELPEAAALESRAGTTLRDVLERNGGSDLALVGTLLEIKEGSGLVLRCSAPGCTRVLTAGQCRLHNAQTGTPDLRIKAVLDDGTGAVSLVAGRELTEQLLGKTLEQAKKEAQEAFRPDVVAEQIEAKLTGRVVWVRGNALSDDYGITFIAKQARLQAMDAAAAAKEALAALEVA